MADNVSITEGSGVAIATDDCGGVQFQKVKLALGADGLAGTLLDAGQEAMAASVPVVIASDQSAVAVSAASLPLPTGAATESTLSTKLAGGLPAALASGGGLKVEGVPGGDALPITAASLPLPTGAAAEAGGNLAACATHLSTIQYCVDGGGSKMDVSDGGLSLTVDGQVSISTIGAGSFTIGSVKVTDGTDELAIAADGSIAVTAASLPLPTGAATETTLSTLNGKVTACNTGSIAGTVTSNVGTGTRPVSNAGTFATQDSQVLADDAVFTVATSKVWASGFLADETSPDKVDEGDVGAARITLDRRLIVQPGSAGPAMVSGTNSATDTSDTAVIGAGGSGVYNYITSIVVYNSSATDTYVNIKDATTTKLVIPAPAAGGATMALPTPLRLADNAALNFASGASVTTMYVSAVGYRATA